MSRSEIQRAYDAAPEKFTHGRCKPCGGARSEKRAVVFAWRAGRRRRLCDGPACPDCGGALTRTTTTLLRGAVIQLRDPVWNPAEAAKLRGGRS